jgi:hypothetical protein
VFPCCTRRRGEGISLEGDLRSAVRDVIGAADDGGLTCTAT